MKSLINFLRLTFCAVVLSLNHLNGIIMKSPLFAFALLMVCANWSKANEYIIPAGLESIEGNTGFAYPFSGFGSGNGMHYQQIYGASDFLTSFTIAEIRFRPDGDDGHAFDEVLGNVRISLSTTSKSVDNLSHFFADNIGLDATSVFNGDLHLTSSFTGPPGNPKDFDVVVNLQNPFIYNPAMGNLLMDVRVQTLPITSFFDVQNSTSDSISRVYSYPFSGSDDSLNADWKDSMGLATKFVGTTTGGSVPDTCATLALLGVSFLGLAALRRRFAA